jgi:hypothetical protein
MNLHNGRPWHVLLILCLVVALSACGGDATPESEPPAPSDTAPAPASPATDTPTPTPTSEAQEPAVVTPTPTPTTAPLPVDPTPAPATSRCQGLAGQLEVQVLVGPADAVGLEPVAVGNVPFAVTTSEPPYLVEGQGPISYEATLAQEWGTYSVNMDLQTTVEGQCSGEAGSEQLDLVLEMTGEQMVVVDAGGFHGEYPWSGTQSRELSFPLQEGATAQGEGWSVVLHLGSP